MPIVRTRTPWSLLLAALYMVVALALLFAALAFGTSPFAGLPFIVITLPWSIVLSVIVDLILPPGIFPDIFSIVINMGTLVLGALLNAVIIYVGASFVERRLRRKR